MLPALEWFQTTRAQQNSKTSRPSFLRNLRLRIAALPHHPPRKHICNNRGRERYNSSLGNNGLAARTSLLPEVPLQIRQPHVPANSIVSRKASGESSFSASSRWHSRTSFKASRRFALASSRVSPFEIAAGISSTKQVRVAFEQATTLLVAATPAGVTQPRIHLKLQAIWEQALTPFGCRCLSSLYCGPVVTFYRCNDLTWRQPLP
jgi:hypothetical protein